MDLVDRYIHAVKRHLPASQQEDIVNELTDDILSQIRDKEEEIGRPLNETEQETILKHYGHPYLLASRYRPQQYLIGPTLFPFYFPALKIALAAAFGIQVIIAFSIGLAERAPERILPHVLAFPGVAFHLMFWVTLAFAVADYWRAQLKLFDNWSPKSLPPVTAGRSPKRGNLIVELVANVVFIAWWLALPTYPFLLLGPASAFLTFSPGWSRLYYIAPIPAAASTVLALLGLVHSKWEWLLRFRPLAVDLLNLFVLSVAIKAGPLIVAVDGTPNLERLAKGINDVATLVLVVITLITMVHVVVTVYRLIHSASRLDVQER
jgi:hypothetical protein